MSTETSLPTKGMSQMSDNNTNDHYITVTSLTKVYGKGKTEAALEGVSASFPSGKMNIIVGPSGSGKTTLLNCIGGLLRPSSGKVVVGGQLISMAPVKELLAYRRTQVGFVFQSYNLIPGVSVWENIALPSYFTKKSKQEVKDRIQSLLDQLKISEYASVDVNNLSGGEQQRVAIAAALVNDPQLLIADEPTAQLDPENTFIVTKLLKEQAKLGKCLLVATHDPRVVHEGDRIYKLDRRAITVTDMAGAFQYFNGNNSSSVRPSQVA